MVRLKSLPPGGFGRLRSDLEANLRPAPWFYGLEELAEGGENLSGDVKEA